MLSLNPSALPGTPAALSFLSAGVLSQTGTPAQTAGASFLPLNPAAPVGTPAPLAFLLPVSAHQKPDETAPYGDIALWVRARLVKTNVELPDAILAPDIAITVATLLDYYPCIGSDYNALKGDDKQLFDKAAGLMTAASLRASIEKDTPFGDLVRATVGANRQYQFAAPAQSKLTIEQKWLKEAYDALRLVSCIRAQWASVASRSMYGGIRMRSGR